MHECHLEAVLDGRLARPGQRGKNPGRSRTNIGTKKQRVDGLDLKWKGKKKKTIID
jgi:hypothetical protein